LLAQDPSIARASIYTAVVCGEVDEVRRLLDARPELARERGDARSWTPILYLAYTRFTHEPTTTNALAIARLLLAHGGNPNDFYMAGDSRYTALVGVAGEGEQHAPRQPYAEALFDLLLEHGAEPFDLQILYNTQFSGDMLWWLRLVHAHTIETPRRAAWRDPEWSMFDMGAYGSGARFVLECAIKRRRLELLEWALDHGATPDAAPARDRRFPQLTLYELALAEGAPEFAARLAAHGARVSVPELDVEQQFVLACRRGERAEAARLAEQHPQLLQTATAMSAAAARDDTAAVALLVDLGCDVNVADRGGKRPLHEAAAANATRAARFLLDRGADPDARESTYNGTPLGWATYSGPREMIGLLAQRSRDPFLLAYHGFVDRLRHVLFEEPERARQTTPIGSTPLWSLPDDEADALRVVDVLLDAGVDPRVRNNNGETAADAARAAGMHAVARHLDAAR
jgi:ankyrin repeat protein